LYKFQKNYIVTCVACSIIVDNIIIKYTFTSKSAYHLSSGKCFKLLLPWYKSVILPPVIHIDLPLFRFSCLYKGIQPECCWEWRRRIFECIGHHS